jgi:hypothetical protein|tara:strand:+ start:449 stop:661 length:213 start_codon:yes stop_codon:yes gene_type:complete
MISFDELVKNLNGTLVCHSRESGNDNYLRMHQICWFAKKSELHPHLNSNPEIDQTQRQLGTASFQQQVEF